MKTIGIKKQTFDDFAQGVEATMNAPDPKLKKIIDYSEYREESIEKQFFLYESSCGMGLLGQPKSIFQMLRNTPGTTHIWSLKNKKLVNDAKEIFKEYQNVIFVKRNTKEYYRYLAVSKYLITDTYFSASFVKRAEQVLIHLGKDEGNNIVGYKKQYSQVQKEELKVRHLLQANYIISPNEEYTEKVLKESYKLDNLCEAKVLEGFLEYESTNEMNRQTEKRLEKLNYDKNKKIILIAADFNVGNSENIVRGLEFYSNLIKKIEKDIDLEKNQIFFSVNQSAYNIFEKSNILKEYLLPTDIDCRDLLVWVECFITNGNGTYLYATKKKVPVLYIDDSLNKTDDNYEEIMYCEKIKKLDANQIVECILTNNYPEIELGEGNSISFVDIKQLEMMIENQGRMLFQSDKKKIMFVANLEMDLGELINLFEVFDYDRYDVTFLPFKPKEDNFDYELVNKNVRLLSHYGRLLYSKDEYAKFLYLNKYVFYADDIEMTIKNELFHFLKRENQRIFNDVVFDIVVLYGDFLPKNYLQYSQIQAKRTIHVQTLDIDVMKQEWETGKYMARYSEFAVDSRIKLISNFDQIICVSRGLLEKEQSNLEFPIYQKAKEIDALLGRKALSPTKERLEKASFAGKDYYANINSNLPYQSKNISLLPLVPDEKESFVHVLSDLSGDSFEELLLAFKKELEINDNKILFIVDNHNIVDETRQPYIAKYGLNKYVILLKNIDLQQNYLKEFGAVISISDSKTEYNYCLAQLIQKKLVKAEVQRGFKEVETIDELTKEEILMQVQEKIAELF